MSFQRCYTQDRIVAYTRVDRPDCAFVFEVPAGRPLPNDPIEAPVLLTEWNAAASAAGVKRRAIGFFSKLTGPALQDAAAFVQALIANAVWDRLVYWRGPDPGSSLLLFPSGDQALVSLMQLKLICRSGDTVLSLDKLDGIGIRWKDDGKLEFAAPAGSQWAVWDDSQNADLAQATSLSIDLERPFHILKNPGPSIVVDSGALQIDIIQEAVSNLPLGFVYRRTKPKQIPNQFSCRTALKGAFLSSIEDVKCFFALDPRDQENHGSTTQRSRIEFPKEKKFKTFVTTDKGLPVLLHAPDSPERASALLQYEMTSGRTSDGNWILATTAVAFVPHGEFVVAGIEGVMEGSVTADPYRIVTGKSATEYVEFDIGDILRFEPGHAAVLKVEGDQAPSGVNHPGNEIHDGTGFITTARLVVRRNGDLPTAFHTQPERSPAFESRAARAGNFVMDDVPAEALTRKSAAYGQVEKPIPFFPYAGVQALSSLQDDENDLAEDIPAEREYDYEQLFLTPERLTVVKREGQTAPAHLQDDSAATTLGVTPQGIISSYVGNDFRELSFGEPSGGTVGGAFANEFKLTLTNTDGDGAKLYEALQQALRGKDLFMVMRKLDATASGVIKISKDFKVRDFTFDVGAKADLGDAVVVLKYFKGKALKDLLPDTTMWACKEQLAREAIWQEPSGGAADANNLSGLVYLKNKDGTYKIPAPLKKIWEDAEWQGVLLLNLTPPAGGMPSLFEALKPGMTEGGLRLHHLGLNYLPVRQEDLEVEKARNGSAFGLMLYTPGTGARPTLDRSDKFPEPNDTTQQPYKPDTAYGFEVKSLEVEFANSQISRFEAEVDASFSHLFWDKAQGDGGKHAIPLRGTYESRRKPDGKTQDIFTLTTRELNEVKFDSSWLDKFVITRAELVVTSSEKTAEGALTRIVTFLGLSGELLFKEPPDFNLFKVEKVTVEKLGLEFDYVPEPESFKCRFRADSIRADVDFGDTGKSLLSSLGLKFKGFRMALDKLLNFDHLGYLPLGNWGGKSLDFHFGLDFELDLGFLGKLSGGKGLKFPLLVGWKAGKLDLSGLGLGISFPNWNGKSFEIGIQSFISIRADAATLKPCNGADGKPAAFAIVLSKARLVFLGQEWPREANLDLALFVPIASGRRLSWVLAFSKDGSWLEYLAAGHRIKLPGGKTTKEVVTNFKTILKNGEGTDPCSLLGSDALADTNAWVVAAHFSLAELVQIWIAACDSPAVYGLRVEMLKSGFSADAMYRQLGPEDGVFSAEVSLPESLRTFQVGIATVRLPKLGLEIYTDGGFKVDLGYPWNNDFSRSFQLEIAIFLGSGGFWFSYTSGLGADWIALPEPANGFTPPQTSDLKQYQAVSAGMAMRVGIGRSFEMGILRGEASLTVFSTLEGGIAFRKGDRSRTPVLYGIRGTMGIMLRIWVEVNFIVLRATAEFCAYALVGFEIRRVLALKGIDHYGLTLPVRVFAEVGIYVHVEIWVTIGCVRVKLFDLEFRGTWHWEETLGGYSADLIQRNAVHELEDDGPVLLAEVYRKVEWTPDYLAFPEGEALDIFIAILPCVADPRDLGIDSSAEHQPCVVTQPMLRIHNTQAPDKIQGFHKLGKFMLGWVLQPPDPTVKITRAQVVDARVQLDAETLWLELMDLVTTPGNPLEKQFAVSLTRVDVSMEADFAALPWWPGLHWQFKADESGTGAPPAGSVQARALAVDGKSRGGDLCMFVDYLRALTGSLLSETERLIAIADDAAKEPNGVSWDELWQQLTESK
ncbi:MAG: hypothetical protein KDN05_01240 [Verrucomicrobiae bacterium]|nr:hypothetical protein [Verrucomicrobiae bacterium]